MEICVLHTEWDSDRHCRYGYALLEYQHASKKEYAIRCFTDDTKKAPVLCWVHPRLAQNLGKAYSLLYLLAQRQVSPVHLEDVLGDMEL